MSRFAIIANFLLTSAASTLAALEQFHMAMVLGNVSFRTAEIEVHALDITRSAIAKAKGIAS